MAFPKLGINISNWKPGMAQDAAEFLQQDARSQTRGSEVRWFGFCPMGFAGGSDSKESSCNAGDTA